MANLKEAFQYAAQNPTSDFANNLKQLAASGSLDQEAKKYNIDLSVFKPKAEEPGIVSRIGTDISNRYDEAKQGLGMAKQAINDTNFTNLTDSHFGKAGTPEEIVTQQAKNAEASKSLGAGLGKVGNAIIGGVSDVINEPIKSVLDTTGASDAIKAGVNAIPQSWKDAVGQVSDSITKNIPQNSPLGEMANMAGNAFNVVATLEGAGQLKNIAKQGVKTTADLTKTAKDTFISTAPIAEKLGLTPDIASKVVKSYVSNASGVSPISQDFIIKTAKDGKFDTMFSPEILSNPRPAEMYVLQNVASKLDNVVGDKGIIGSQYKQVLSNAKPFNFSRQSLINNVVDSTKLKYSIKNGFYKTADTANIADSDITKLNSLLNTYKGIKTLSGDQFKVLRDTVKDLAYDNGLKSTSGEYIAKKLYASLNNTYRPNIPGLKELDSKFSDAIDNINEIKSYFTKDSQGGLVLKDNAERQLSALLERGNERKLATIKQFIPDAADKIAYANTLRNLDVAQGNLVGNYGKTGGNIMAGMAGTAIGGPAGGIAAFLANLYASNPTNVAKAIGKIYRPAEDLSSAIINKAPTIPNTIKNDISASIAPVTKKASGKMGGFAQLTKETPEGNLKGKILPEDADSVVDFADAVNGDAKVADSTYLAMRKEIKGIAKQYGVIAKSDRELVDKLQKKIYNDYHKFPGFADLGLLPKLAIGTAVATGGLKAGLNYVQNKKK